MTGYVSVSLPGELVEMIDKLINEGKYGYKTRPDFVADAVRRFLMEMERRAEPPAGRWRHFNTYEDHVTIIDHNYQGRERLANIYFQASGKYVETWCDLCDSTECVHIDFAWEVPKVREKFEKQNLERKKRAKPKK